MNNGSGDKSNPFQVGVVISVVKELVNVTGAEGMKGRICVLAPYLAQVRRLQEDVQAHALLRNLDMHIDSIDSMQGCECDVVIFLRQGPILASK